MESPIESRPRYSVEEYLRLEGDSAERHEFRDGQIVAVSGGTEPHSLIIANVVGALWGRLRGGPCRVYESNLRLRIPRKPLYCYPDASIVCGPAQYDPQGPQRTTILNPRIIIEVLSPSTEAYDRGEKFTDYREIDSLEEYVLIDQKEPSVQTFLRQGDGTWSFAAWAGMETAAKIRCLGLEIPMAELYAGVEFPPRDDAAQAPSL
jgi:Uma2 family endonuclease